MLATDVRREVEFWCTRPALAELVRMFGASVPAGLDLVARLAWLDEFSAVWDYRGRARTAGRVDTQDAAGAVRWLIPRLDRPQAQLQRIQALSADLGLVDEFAPTGTDFDFLLVIGGGRYTNRLRIGYARELAIGRRIGHVVLAAASRAVMDSERDAIEVCAPWARTEFDLVVAAAAESFGIDAADLRAVVRSRRSQPPRDQAVWRVSPDSNNLGVPITLLETASPEPGHRRANSADTYTFAAQTVGMQHCTCLQVAGQPVLPYLHFEALRTLALPFGIHLQSAGFGVDRYNRLGVFDEQHPAKILQEVRSAIRSARALVTP
ncbi:hypothetical protein [Mycobacterium vicinigordonae]|uniref:Uncharacterized protein n=1 Tax=Mycobacterium vicinigordonae TaxID=1719132 RepID=A0A7D6IBK1_9MYCO|nr:hypothetical protein [Mycobacterium vicinigordonae]QLL09637.1 hypothetical protein H0P51_12655 [Mycobacterium vicinigordonae]